MSPLQKLTLWRFLYQSFRAHPGAVGTMFLSALIVSVNTSWAFYFIKVIVDRAEKAPLDDIWSHVWAPVVLLLAGVFSVATIYRIYGYFVEIRMLPAVSKKIAIQYFDRLLGYSHQYYQNNFSGTLVNKVQDLVTYSGEILQIITDSFACLGFTALIAILTVWTVSWVFALALFAWVALVFGVFFLFAPYITQLSETSAEVRSSITGKMVDVLSNILSVRLFARQDYEHQTLVQLEDMQVAAERRLNWGYFWVWLLYGYSFFLIQAVSLYFLVEGYAAEYITLGDFALVLGINISMVNTLSEIMPEFSRFSRLWGRIGQALSLTVVADVLQDKPGAPDLVVRQGEISFEAVKFNYPGTPALFSGKSLKILGGQKVGLVGYSGSGKSTLVNLILRLYDVTSGRILIDGQDIRDVTQASLHRAIGMIPQDPSLFHRSLLENIRYGREDATEADVRAAARQANADDFIEALPEKYDTKVGERGVKLSGGQRQRIAIARAILKNAPILILDEATSQLDSLTEGDIQKSLWAVMEGKTTLVVAHRLSTLLQMDRILVLDKGRVVQDGSHQALLAEDGLYRTMWEAQSGGFLPAAPQ